MKKYSIEIKWAFIFIGSLLLWMIFEKSMGWHDEHIADHAVYTNFFSVVAIVLYILALLDKRKNYYSGIMSYKEGFVSGVVISIIIALFSPLTQWIIHELITPDYFPNIIEYAVNSGQSTQEEAETYFTMKSYIVQSLIFALITGIITSAIVALFIRKRA